MVYAVGNPTTHSMKRIVHTVALRRDGSLAPDRIATGSAGLARPARITTFGSPLPSGLALRAAATVGRHPG
jgi:hypothetical protein